MNAGTLAGNSGKALWSELESSKEKGNDRYREGEGERGKKKGIQPASDGRRASAQEIKLMS